VKYKTLFRLALKVMGVYLVITVLIELPWTIWYHWNQIASFPRSNTYTIAGTAPMDWLYTVSRPLTQLLQLGAGLYLFFGGEWIVNRAIPSNRNYCHECGYLLKELKGSRCPECDTPFQAEGGS